MTASHNASREDGPRDVLPMREQRRAACLGDVLQTIASSVTAARQKQRLPEVSIALDVNGGREIVADTDAIWGSIEPIVASACDAATAPGIASDGPRLREVVITVVDTPRGLEIEVADSGPGPGSLPADSLVAARRHAEHHGGCLVVTACPEGGAAVTLCLPSRRIHGLTIRPAA